MKFWPNLKMFFLIKKKKGHIVEKCLSFSIGEDIIAYFRTKDMYDMLKSFREYRDNYYSQR